MRALSLILLLAPVPAAAQAAACRIEIRGLDFGTYRSLDPVPNVRIGRLDVRCTPLSGAGAIPRVTLSPGNSGQYVERTMTSGDNVLRYNLYAEPTRRLVLGDGSEGSIAFPSPRTRAFGTASWPIFAAIVPGQRVPAGVYTDTLLIQVEF